MLNIKSLGKASINLDREILYTPSNNLNRYLLLAYLAETKQPHPRLEIASLFWPEAEKKSQLRSLINLIHRIKQDGLGGYIESNKRFIQFKGGDLPYQFDLEDLRRAVSNLSTHSTLSQLETSFQYFKGPFLANLDLASQRRLADWAYSVQHEIESKLINVYRLLAPKLIEAGQPTKGAEYGRILTDRVEDDELTWVWYIRCLAAQGEIAKALQLLGQYRQQLLITDPTHRFSDELLALGGLLSAPSEVAQLMWQDDVQDEPAKISAKEFNVPNVVVKLLGRETFITNLHDTLIEPHNRLVTLTGLGGIGKTQMALAIGHQLASSFRDGVVFVDLRSLNREALIKETLSYQDISDLLFSQLAIETLSSMEIKVIPHSNPPFEQLVTALEGKELLLIYDNFEHLIEGASFLSAILQAADNVTILVTSRIRLGLRGESVLQLPPLDYANQPSDKDHPPILGSGVQLFIDRAKRLNGQIAFQNDELHTIQKICELVGGLPLAIEHAASWTSYFSLNDIVEEIEKSYTFLKNNWALEDDPHRSIQFTLHSSYQYLSQVEKQTLLAFSLFHLEFSREAALAVSEADISTLVSLVDRNLVHQVRPGWFSLHPLVAQMVLEKTHDWSESDQNKAIDLFVDYFLSIAANWDANDTLWKSLDDLWPISSRLENDLFQAWNWGVSRKAYPQLERSVWVIFTYIELTKSAWHTIEFFSPSYQALSDQVPDSLKSIDSAPSGYTRLFVDLLHCLANTHLFIGDYPSTVGFCTQALTLLEGTSFYRPYSVVPILLSICQIKLADVGDIDEKSLYQLALEKSKHVIRRSDKVLVMGGIALYHKLKGEYDIAEKYYRKGMDLSGLELPVLNQMFFNALLYTYSIQNKHQAVISIIEEYEEAAHTIQTFVTVRTLMLKGKHLLLANRPQAALEALRQIESNPALIGSYEAILDYYRSVIFAKLESQFISPESFELNHFTPNASEMVSWLKKEKDRTPADWVCDMSTALAALAAGLSLQGNQFKAGSAFRQFTDVFAQSCNEPPSYKFELSLVYIIHYVIKLGESQLVDHLMAYLSENISDELIQIGYNRLLTVYAEEYGKAFHVSSAGAEKRDKEGVIDQLLRVKR